MMAYCNQVQLLGTITDDPSVRYTKNRRSYGMFTLAVSEPSPNGHAYTVLVHVIAWSKTVPQMRPLTHGAQVLVSGKLDRRQLPGGQWQLYINASAITVVGQGESAPSRPAERRDSHTRERAMDYA